MRSPASACGVVGIRGTRGLISRGGVCPVSWSQDAVGPIARTVEDVMAVFEVISGYFDVRDNTTAVSLKSASVDDSWRGFIRDRDPCGKQH